MNLGSLPDEILTTLGGVCGYTELASLARANHTFHAIFNPILYKLNAADIPRKSCLHWAVEHNRLSTLKKAIAHGADINNTGAEDESYVLRLSDGPQSNNCPDEDIVYASPLHISVMKKRPEMVRWLLDNNARLDVPSYKLCSCDVYYWRLWYPLHFAICHSNDEILCLLLKRGAFYAAKDCSGLYCAITSGAVSAVDILTQQDSFDPDYVSSGHTTALHWVRRCVGMEIVGAITKILVQRGVPVNVQDEDGTTALFCFVTRVMLEPAIILLRHGADPTLSPYNDRGTAMLRYCFGQLGTKETQRHWGFEQSNQEAFTKRRLELAELIIKGGVNVNGHHGHEGVPFSRPLFWALTETQDVRWVQLVLDAGADIPSAVVETYDTESESLLRYFLDLFDENTQSDEWVSVPFDTDLRKYKESMCLLLEKGARIDAVGDEYSALSKACELERKKGALTLLVNNATSRNTELGNVGKLRERYKADKLIYRLLNGFYCQLEVEMRTEEQETASRIP
ncbi:hypothetical protein HG530_010655 [Fusarium avenaceum]|nr:hypothetical protein HG530_010655 [Fusarium avenaceum]